MLTEKNEGEDEEEEEGWETEEFGGDDLELTVKAFEEKGVESRVGSVCKNFIFILLSLLLSLDSDLLKKFNKASFFSGIHIFIIRKIFI